MRKMTRLVLISAVFVTSGLTAKIATENYKVVADNDERIHKAYELAKKPNKAAVLEAIVDAANAEPDERIRDAVVLEPEEPKVVRIKTKVTTSAGVSPIASVMDKKTVNKAEEFIEKVAHPEDVVMEKNLDFTPENIPIQELKYEVKDIFPEFEEVTEKPLTYKITLPELASYMYSLSDNFYLFDVNDNVLNCINIDGYSIYIIACEIEDNMFHWGARYQGWKHRVNNETNVIKCDPETRTVDYSDLVSLKDSEEKIKGARIEGDIPTCKEVYTFLTGVKTGNYKLLEEMVQR